MKTIISVQDVLKCNGCESGLDEGIALAAMIGVPADGVASYEDMLNLAIQHNKPQVVRFLQQNKAQLLEYGEPVFKSYHFRGADFNTIEEANVAKDALIKERRQYHANLTTVGFTELVGQDHVWRPVDLDTFEVPGGVTEYQFHIFNHKTGGHKEAATLDEARTDRAAMIESHVASESDTFVVYKKYVYTEDGVTFKLE